MKADKTCNVCKKKIKKGEYIIIYESGKVVHEKCRDKNVSIPKK